jgi:hypothetical protein
VRLRPASLFDLVRIEQIYRQAEARFSTDSPSARLWSLVSQTLTAFLPLTQESLLYVAEEQGKVAGFIQASGPIPALSLPNRATALQVLNLCVSNEVDKREVAPLLLGHLVRQAGVKGVNRLFVRIPLDDPLLTIFRAQAFRQFATESVLFAESPSPAAKSVPAGVRAYRGRDGPRVYSLYRRVTPVEVAQLEAPTYRAWQASRGIPGQQEVVERQSELVAWSRVHRGSQARPHILSFLALPDPELAAQLADHVLDGCQNQPAWSSLRHYDAAMIDALRGRGFSSLLSQGLLVRETTARESVSEQGLVPSFG